jgi:hypothetical protein
VSLFTELKWRVVVKVGGGYLVVAWLIAATGCLWPVAAKT